MLPDIAVILFHANSACLCSLPALVVAWSYHFHAACCHRSVFFYSNYLFLLATTASFFLPSRLVLLAIATGFCSLPLLLAVCHYHWLLLLLSLDADHFHRLSLLASITCFYSLPQLRSICCRHSTLLMSTNYICCLLSTVKAACFGIYSYSSLP